MEIAVFAVAALVVGLALGWFLGGRPAVQWREQANAREREARELDAKYLRTFADLEAMRERAGRADSLAEALESARAEHGEAIERLRGDSAALLERLRNDHAAAIESHQNQKRELTAELATLRE